MHLPDLESSSKMRDLGFLLVCLLAVSVAVAGGDTDDTGGAALNDDVLGLIVFKSDLTDPYNHLASWNEDDSVPCRWFGVTCDPRTGRAAALSLPSLSLSGRLGRGLLRLTSLRSLSLPNNNLSGPLPPDLPLLLPALRHLDLSSNRLAGPIPPAFFAHCHSLRSLSLAANALSGDIPSSLGSCSTLASLNLSSNLLSGIIPNTLWSLQSLRSLDLSDNSLTGILPGEIGSMYNLRSVSLRGNQLSGALPYGIGRCLLLKSLDLSWNSLTGGLPASMRWLSMCTMLTLSANSFSGEVPEWIGQMTSLQLLDLSANGFSGHLPDSLGSLQLLKELNLSGNALTGGLPESMLGCKSLLSVDFSRNSLTGSLPSWISQLGLQRVLVSGNNLSGSIKTPTGSGGKMLQVLDLSGNAFSGGIPSDIGNAGSLLMLNLSQNSLSGAVPARFGELKWLEVLDISQNRLNGSIPPEIGGAASLVELRLEKNSLAGPIPSQIGNCSSLTTLVLSQNYLTGPIPPTIANLTGIQTIDLSLNRLTGTLPKQLANLPNLLAFNVSHNLLSGDLPGGSFFNTIDPASVSDNPGLCGAAVNRSCPGVLPKPIVLNPNSSATDPSAPAFPTGPVRHKKIILSISVIIAIGAAILMAIGVITITILNARFRATATTQSAAALVLSDDYCSRSPGTDANSGKLIMFSGDDPEFSAGTHAVLNKDCELGRGGFGTVYKTVLRDGRPVAIKKLTVSSLVKSQDDFERVVKKLGRTRHQNLITLEGYYWTPSLQLLIYEFVPGGSLHKHLHESSSSESLSWQERFDIILGMARSLAHLHSHGIIHYNLKSSNVLIDGAGEPKMGDYGLAKLLPMLDRYVLSSKIQSALGYMAPEFACRAVKITEKCDVYGFGVLVLEVVTGRRPVEYMEDDVVMLCDIVRSSLEGGRVEECVDERLGGRFPPEEALPVMKLGLICTSQVPSNRPDMGEVVNILELIRSPDSQEEDLS